MMDNGSQDSGIQAQLAQISMELGKQSTQLAVITTKLDVMDNRTLDHESRIRMLETAKAKLYGGAGAIGLLSGGVATLVYWGLQQHH
jgi:hypothetical protein